MIAASAKSDTQLRNRLSALTDHNRDFWSFAGNARREHGHGLFQYPAMMVPQVVRAVLGEICAVHPEAKRVADPFVGSGTILTESMLQGLSFTGRDINPLAVLLCRTKAGPFFVDALEGKATELKDHIYNDRRASIDIDFPNRNKWFRRGVQIGLSKIRRAVQQEEAPWARRFFWIALAEAARLTSNSRTSTFKLHIRPEAEMKAHASDATSLFEKAVDRNLRHLRDQKAHLEKGGYLSSGHYVKSVDITLGDTRQINPTRRCDIVITSPPYGDNPTTVPYGQHAYLPLQWVDLQDIDPTVDDDYLCSTHEIDARSLGGSRRITDSDRESLCDLSRAFRRYISSLKGQPPDRCRRVIAFFRDLDRCLHPILQMLRPGGLMVWILGNRKVGGRRVPLDTILRELVESRHASLICRLMRRIPSKRMAVRNSIAETISTESILVMRKAL